MRKKISKIIILAIYILTVFSICTNVYAAGAISGAFNGELGAADGKVEPIITIISAILVVIRMAGVAIAMVILMILAAKYMIASAGDRADIKKYAISYIIGAVVLFGASGIAGILKEIIDGAFGD